VKENCECGEPGVLRLIASHAVSGEVLDEVVLCCECAKHPRTRRALDTVGLAIGPLQEAA